MNTAKRRQYLPYMLGWIPMVPLAIINGTVRELTYSKFLSDLTAHQLSTLTGIVIFGLYIRWLIQRWPPTNGRMAISIGLIWLTMTILFEFGFGHFVMGNSWERLLHDYNLLQGRIWLLVLLWTATAPYLFYKLAQRDPAIPVQHELS
jgi:hypothetical protein